MRMSITPLISEEPATSEAGATDLGATGLRPHHWLIIAAWCGLVAGPLEVAIIVLRKHTVDLNHFYWMSRHFVWLIPLTDLLIFLILGLMLALLAVCWPRGGGWLGARLALRPDPAPATLGRLPADLRTRRVRAGAGDLHAAGPSAGAARVRVPSRDADELPDPAGDCGAPAGFDLGLRSARRSVARRRGPCRRRARRTSLVIVLDTVAAGHLSLHGYERPTSPTLDGLARRGIRFDRAQATSSWTLPSHAGFFTGRWPHELSAGWLTPLDATYTTLAEYLGSRGYATAGFVANLFYCGSDTGLERGFTRYQDYIFPGLSAFRLAALVDRPLEGVRAIHRFLREHAASGFFPGVIQWFDAGNRKPASVINREFLDWLAGRRQPERPFFAFLNYYDVHYPYQTPEGSIRRFGARPRNDREMDLIETWRTVDKPKLSAREVAFVRDAYDDCVAHLDEQLGRLVDDLGRSGVLDRTWLIITSDHGESFGEQPGVFLHGTSLYQAQLHVPLVIVPPVPARTASPRVVAETVSLRDIPATVVDLLGPGVRRAVPRRIAGAALGPPGIGIPRRSRSFRTIAGPLRGGPGRSSG